MEVVEAGGIVLGPGFGRGAWLAARGDGPTLSVRQGGANPWAVLQNAVESMPARGGLVGYMSYEAAGFLEPGLRLPKDPQGFPILWAQYVEDLRQLPKHPTTARSLPGLPQASDIADHTGRAAYIEKVVAVQRAIRRGDIFQANISRRIDALFPNDPKLPAGLFSRMLANGAASYAAFMPLGRSGATVLSNSPEMYLSIEGARIISEPIKGTRPRGTSPEADRRLAEELLRDRKDRAENIMIADLLRNDLARVSRDHTILEEEICTLRTLPYVHHLYSRLSGELRDGVGPVEALASCFPCGSITGAPKHRAMEIIAGVEGVGRGPYCGSVFLIRPDGDMVSSVAIRTGTLVTRPGEAELRMNFGGGITMLSDPNAEYEETVHKSAPFGAMIK